MGIITQQASRGAGFAISDWKAIDKNTLRGVFMLHLPSGMVIHNVMLHRKNDCRWIALPAKEYQVNGERKFARIIEFDSKETHERFQAAALAAIDAAGVKV
jgi:DNA-binding cell septation regulator SpoVG